MKMNYQRFSAITFALAILSPLTATAAGIIPDRINQIILKGDFSDPEPTFLLICSAQPLKDPQGRLLVKMSDADLRKLRSTENQVVIKLHGKKPTGSRLDYFFGTGDDATMTWNNGTEFDWKDWTKHSPDIWDNVCLAAFPPAPGKNSETAVIRSVTIRLGGQVLFDSRATQSYPNAHPIQVALEQTDLTPQNGTQPLLNLSERMTRFRTDYYELGNNPILQLAYSDLSQTDKLKYAKRGNAWCSEFASYIYRECKLPTPDPNRENVYYGNMRKFFEKHGKVYPAREVATWSNEKKRDLIKPGSFVAILIDGTNHSIIFTTWVLDGDKPITSYVGISGNNKGMVWSHVPQGLPNMADVAKMTKKQLKDFDEMVYFAVPSEGR